MSKVQRWRLTILHLALVTFLLASISAGSSAQKEIQAIIARTGRPNEPGVAVLVRKDGKVLVKLGHGVRDLHSHAKIDAFTNFRMASCTKQFTAMAIMLLVRDGKLRYDERLTEVFPKFPEYGRAITIRHLLDHTSGLPDYEELMDKASAGSLKWSESRQITDAEVLKLLATEKAGRFSPGTHWAYSNSGYVALGLIVAKVSGESFPEFLHDRIFGPLKMDRTVAYVREKNEVPNRAYGHSLQNGAVVETDQSSTSAVLGDGGVYSSLDDLAKWDRALEHHTLLSEPEMKPAITPVKVPDESVQKCRRRWCRRECRTALYRTGTAAPETLIHWAASLLLMASAGSSIHMDRISACGTTARRSGSGARSSGSRKIISV